MNLTRIKCLLKWNESISIQYIVYIRGSAVVAGNLLINASRITFGLGFFSFGSGVTFSLGSENHIPQPIFQDSCCGEQLLFLSSDGSLDTLATAQITATAPRGYHQLFLRQ